MYDELIREMQRKKITGYKLAQLTNISKPDIYSALKGKKPFYPAWRRRIAAALNVPENKIFPDPIE